MEWRKKIYKGVTLIYSMQDCNTCRNAVDMFWSTFTRLSFTRVCVRYGAFCRANTFALAYYVHLLYILVFESGQEFNIAKEVAHWLLMALTPWRSIWETSPCVPSSKLPNMQSFTEQK